MSSPAPALQATTSCDDRPAKRVCLPSSKPLRRNGVPRPMVIAPSDTRLAEHEHATANISPRRTSSTTGPSSGSDPPNEQEDNNMEMVVDPSLEHFEDQEGEEYDDWDDYDPAEMILLDELDAPNLEPVLPDQQEADVFYNPRSTSRLPVLALAPLPIESSGSHPSSPQSASNRSPEPLKRYVSSFTTGHPDPKPILFNTVSGPSLFSNHLPFRAPSKVHPQSPPSQTELPNSSHLEPTATQSVPILGFKTGNGRSVPNPSKEAVKKALEGFTAINQSTRSTRVPDSPTPQAKAPKLLEPPLGSPSLFVHRSDHQTGSAPSKRGLIDQQDLPDHASPRNTKFKELRSSSQEPRLPDENATAREILLRPNEHRCSPRPQVSALEDVSNRGHVTPPPNRLGEMPVPAVSSTAKPETPLMSRFVGSHGSATTTARPHPATLGRRMSRPIGLTPQSVQLQKTIHTGPRSFVTPFKLNAVPLRLNNYGAATTPREATVVNEQQTPTLKSSRLSISAGRRSVIDLRLYISKQRLLIQNWLSPPTTTLTPRYLFSLGVPESIVLMTLKSSKLWHFDRLSDEPFGPLQALGELYRAGCLASKASPQWMAGHWALIIWKLSGIVRWLPSARNRVWNAPYVVGQLKYRYEREFNYGHRSAIRSILDHECPTGAPICLVVVSIKLEEADEDSRLELSDGWYKIRSTLDKPLLNVLRQGRLKVGQKLAIGGTFVAACNTNNNDSSMKKKDGEEEEEEPELKLEANYTSRARWYEKLGFRVKPWYSSLRSLTFDGGRICWMDLVVLKVYGTMFVNDDVPGRGGGARWGSEEEVEQQKDWEIARQTEADKISVERQEEYEVLLRVRHSIRVAFEAKQSVMITILGKDDNQVLSVKADNRDNFDVDEWLEGLIEGTIELREASNGQLVELLEGVNCLIGQFERTDVHKILDERVPHRKIRRVCTLKVRDFQSFRNEGNRREGQRQSGDRTAQLLIQDLSRVEEGLLKEGHRYWVQNLQPQRKIVWDARNPNSELFLCTRRDTKWRRVGLDE